MSQISSSDRLLELVRLAGGTSAPGPISTVAPEIVPTVPSLQGAPATQVEQEDPLETAIRTRAMALLSGKSTGTGGGGVGSIPQTPTPLIDYEQMARMLAAQSNVGGGYTPRTMGMTMQEVQSQFAPLNTAMENQMKQLQGAGQGTNVQQREHFDDDMKRWSMRQQAANANASANRSEIAQYLGLAHQMAQDKRQQAMLERQLKRDEVTEEQRWRELELKEQAIGARSNKLSDETKRVWAYAASLRSPGVDQKALQQVLSDPNLGPALTRRIQTQWKNMDADIVKSSPEDKDMAAVTIIREFMKDAQNNPLRAVVQTPAAPPAANDPEELMRRALFGGTL